MGAYVECDTTTQMSWADRFNMGDNFHLPYPSTAIAGARAYGGPYHEMTTAQKTAYQDNTDDTEILTMLVTHGLGANIILPDGTVTTAKLANTGFGANVPGSTDPCDVPSLAISCPQTCLAKQGFYTRPDGKQIGTLYCFLTHMQEEFSKALGDQVINGTGVVSTAQNGALYDFKSLGDMSDKELTKWAASNVVDIEFKAAASSMGHYSTGGASARVTKAELLYYFASICKPEEVIAAGMVPKAVQLFDEFDKDSSGDLSFMEFYDFYEYAMDMSIQAYGPVEFLLFWFVHPMLTQMGGEQFSLQDWKGEMRGGLVSQKLELTLDINPDLICSPTSGRDGGDCQRASFGTSGTDGWDSSRVEDDSLYVQGYYYDATAANADGSVDKNFKPKVSCARTHALAQTTLKHTLEDLLGVHAGMIDVTEHGANTVKDQQVAHAGKACPAIKVTLNVPNASKTLADLVAVKDAEDVSCAPSEVSAGTPTPQMCLQFAKALGMEYLYKAASPGFAKNTDYGNPTGGEVETAYTASNKAGYKDSRPFFGVGANGAIYNATIVLSPW